MPIFGLTKPKVSPGLSLPMVKPFFEPKAENPLFINVSHFVSHNVSHFVSHNVSRETF